ncbi:MAG TPA: hypothetical protein VEK33_07285 [Terriglobales bacterium]|nr:hypothetical protein [Terriglobales bacterium]
MGNLAEAPVMFSSPTWQSFPRSQTIKNWRIFIKVEGITFEA